MVRESGEAHALIQRQPVATPVESGEVEAWQDLSTCKRCPLQGLVSDEKASKETVLQLVQTVLEHADKLTKTAVEKAKSELLELQAHLPDAGAQFDMGKVNQSALEDIGKLFYLTELFTKMRRDPILRQVASMLHLRDSRKDKDDSTKEVTTSFRAKMWYVLLPCVMFFFAFAFQSFMLHVATHFYIYYMEHGSEERRRGGGMLFDLVGNAVAQFVVGQDKMGQGAVVPGRVDVPLSALDATGGIPVMLCFMTYIWAWWKASFNIHIWTKTFLVGSMVAVLKGVLDVVTILPDSIGWDECKDRLTKSGLDQLREMPFARDFWHTVLDAFVHEVLGGRHGRRIRYCADMMVSGHTYFAAVFALSAYKQVSDYAEIWPSFGSRCLRRLVYWVSLVAITIEVLLVAAARFHYTVDVIISLVLVALLFDSRYVESVAASWSEGFHWWDPSGATRSYWGFCCTRRVIQQHSEALHTKPMSRSMASLEAGLNLEAVVRPEGSELATVDATYQALTP
jgi:hypothetical protein